jgi:parallel beta-helix repeat protein
MRIALQLRPFYASKPNPIVVVFLFVFFLCFVPLAKADTTVGGAITTDTTWTLAQSPYIVTSNLTVKGTDGTDGITTLSIEPGVEVRLDRYRQFIVGGPSGDPGALVAQGTAASPIVFTSSQASPAVGDWYYIKFDNTSDDSTTVLEHCLVEYAGYSQGAINLNNASPAIADTTIRHSKYAGIYMNSSSPTINGCTFWDNNGYGINMSSSSPTLSNCTFTNSGNFDLYYTSTVGGTVSGCTINNGIYIPSGILGAITGNTINYNAGYPIRIGADGVGELLAQNTLNNLDADSLIEVTVDTIERDATWSPALKYLI